MIKKIFSLILIGILIPTLAFGGVDFDGVDDLVKFGEDVVGNALNGASAVSIVILYKSDVNLSSGAVEYLIYIPQNAGSGGIVFFLTDSGGTEKLQGGGRSISSDPFKSKTINFDETGNWVIVLLILDFANNEISIATKGGAISTSGTSFGQTTYNDADSIVDATIGGNDGGTDMLNGPVAHVAIWTTVLTQREWEIIANAKMKNIFSQIQPSSLVFDWWLDGVGDGDSADGVTFVNRANPGTGDGTGDDGAGNDNLLAKAEEVLSYQP